MLEITNRSTKKLTWNKFENEVEVAFFFQINPFLKLANYNPSRYALMIWSTISNFALPIVRIEPESVFVIFRKSGASWHKRSICEGASSVEC